MRKKVEHLTAVSFGEHYIFRGKWSIKICHIYDRLNNKKVWKCINLRDSVLSKEIAENIASEINKLYGIPIIKGLYNLKPVTKKELSLLMVKSIR